MITSFIPTYKRPEQLKRAIESILNQTHRDFKLVVLDNASGDETEAVVRSYMVKDPRVHYHCHKQNLGMLGNYAYAFNHIDTLYFNILSDDDFVHPWFLETALKDLENFPDTAYCACAIEALNEEGVCISNSIGSWSRDGYYGVGEGALEMTSAHAKFPMPTGVLFRTKLVESISPDLTPEMMLLWDPDYLTQIAARHPIIANKRCCGIFTAHDDGFSSAFYKKLYRTAEDYEQLVVPCMRIIERIQESNALDECGKAAIVKNLRYYVTSFSKALDIRYIRLKCYDDVETIFNVTTKHLGKDFYLSFLTIIARTCKRFNLFHTFLMFFREWILSAYLVLKRVRG